MSRYDEHDDYEEFVTKEARKNLASIKAALAAGGEKALQEAINDLIWEEAERRAEATAEQRAQEGAAAAHRIASAIKRRAEEQSWHRLQAGNLEFS